MTTAKRNFLFLNIGHLLDHFFMLIFTTAVLTMESEFADSYGRLLPVSYTHLTLPTIYSV